MNGGERMAKTDEQITMERCLEEAKDCWKEVFYQDGYGEKFDRYSMSPEPVAIAMIAIALFNRNES